MGNGHIINIDNRERITITDVIDVESFNEDNVLLILKNGGLVIKGRNLHMQKLDLEEGSAVITGFVNAALYTEKKDKQDKGFFNKILK
jgi:sporulation protein YabP